MEGPPDETKILAELILAASKELTSSILDKIKKVWLKKEYGITLNPEEGESIKKIAETQFYLLFKKYLGQHWSLNLIKVGLYISQLNEDGRKERAKQISDEAYKKYGEKGARIIQLASTGTLISIMDHIIDLKHNKDANCIVLNQAFDKILEEWELISIPVNRDMDKIKLEDEIKSKISTGHSIFFVYGCGSAAQNAFLTIAKMNVDGYFSEKYFMTPKNKIINDVDYCLWTFEKIDGSFDTIIAKEIKK